MGNCGTPRCNANCVRFSRSVSLVGRRLPVLCKGGICVADGRDSEGGAGGVGGTNGTIRFSRDCKGETLKHFVFLLLVSCQ